MEVNFSEEIQNALNKMSLEEQQHFITQSVWLQLNDEGYFNRNKPHEFLAQEISVDIGVTVGSRCFGYYQGRLMTEKEYLVAVGTNGSAVESVPFGSQIYGAGGGQPYRSPDLDKKIN